MDKWIINITINCRKARKSSSKKKISRKNLPMFNNPCYSSDVDSNIEKGKEDKNMYTVFDIANWFLQKQPMEHKKVQKLCYYAQAWSLALMDRKLIDSDFEAWVHGPVNRSLWNRLKENGYSPVSSNTLERESRAIDSSTKQFLEMVWATYKDFSGFQLESLTHSENPWIYARKGLSSSEPSSRKIDNQLMKEYYRNLVSSEGVGE